MVSSTFSRVWVNCVRCQSCLWSAEEAKIIFSLSPFAPENLVSRQVRPPRPASACSFFTVGLNLVLTHGILPAFRDGVHLFISSTAIGPVPSLSGYSIAYHWRSLPRVRWHRATGPQGSSSNRLCLFRFYNEAIFYASVFPRPLGM